MKTMSMRGWARAAVAAFAIAVAVPVLAEDATLTQVYDAVHAGNLRQAETMMTDVLRDHPNSAKAHYVEAEIYAREGRRSEAATELAQAERIAPGLPFAKSESTEALRALIAGNATRREAIQPASTPVARGFSFGPLVLIAGAALLVWLVLRARRAAARAPIVGGAPYGSGPAGYGPSAGYGGAPVAPYGGGGGVGSGILGGLATGAAVGAGMVAGEALAHDLMDRHGHAQGGSGWTDGGAAAPLAGNDIDDRDFGVQDSGSWDDGGGGGSGGSDDWS